MQVTNQPNNNGQPNDNNQLRLSIHFNRADLHLEYSLIGVVVYLKDFPTVDKPGSPALPQGTIRIALPPQAKLLDIHTEVRKSELISNDIIPIAPQQPLRPGQHKVLSEKPNKIACFFNKFVLSERRHTAILRRMLILCNPGYCRGYFLLSRFGFFFLVTTR